MNIFELSFIASHLAGAIAGGAAVKAPGIGWAALGVVVGLAIGLALYLTAISIGGLLARFCMGERLNLAQWLASLTAMLLPAASPFGAWVLSDIVVAGVVHP